MKLFKQQSGAALIMTVLIVSIFSIATLAIGRVLTSEIKLNSAYGSQEKARWAAEAGLEKGLLYLREHRDQPVFPNHAGPGNELYLRSNLIDNSDETTNISDEVDNNQAYNYLRIYDQVSFDQTEFVLDKDQGITLRPIDQASLVIKWFVIDSNDNLVPGSINCQKNRLYIRKDKLNGDFETTTFPVSQNSCSQGSTTAINIDPSTDQLIQLKGFLNRSDQKTKLIITTNSGKLVGGPYLYLESIGLYNGTRNKLVAKINREDLTASNLMDYIIFTDDSIGR